MPDRCLWAAVATCALAMLAASCGSDSAQTLPAPAPPALQPAPDAPPPVEAEPPPVEVVAPPPPDPLHVEVHQRGAVKRVEWTWDASVAGPPPVRWWVYEYGTACANQPYRDPWGVVSRMRNSDLFPSHRPGWWHVNWTGDSGGCDEVRVCAGNGRRCSERMRWPGR